MEHQYEHDAFISFSFKDQNLAENIVNLLSSQYGITCWICTRDVDGGTRYKRLIPDAIDHSKVLVFLQSSSSIESKEIPKEIGMAFDADIPIIPFRVDDAKLKGDLRYDLYGIEYIDATVPTFEERVEELAKAIRKITGKDTDAKDGKEGAQQTLLSTPNVIPKVVFCGRDGLLSEIDAKFRSGERVLFLSGIGGIGKTQIAKQYAKQYSKNYDTIIYATYHGNIREMLLAEAPFSIHPELVRYTLSNGEKEDDDAFLARKMKLFHQLTNERTLIILDNFDVDDDEDLPMLMNGNHHLLITTRCDYSRLYPTLRIDPINSMDLLKEIFMKNYQGDDVDADDPALVMLIELVDRHTYTIELLAQHMENSGQTPTEMIAALKERGIMSLDEEVRNSDMKTQRAYENLIKMFNLFALDAEERQILMYLSLMPIDGVGVHDFRQWADLKSSRILRKLENHGWILRNTGGIALHPIIKEVVKHKIPVTIDEIRGFLTNFGQTIKAAWGYSKEQKETYASIALSIREVVGEINESTFDFFYFTQRLLSYSVNPDLSLKIGKELYAFCESNYPVAHHNTARAAYCVGWTYQFNSFWPDALEKSRVWLEKCYEIYKNLTLENTEHRKAYNAMLRDLADAYYLLKKAFPDEGTTEKAKEFHRIAIDYSMSVLHEDPLFSAILAGTYIGLSGIYSIEKDFQNALLYGEKAYQIFAENFGQEDVDTAHAMAIKATALYALKEYQAVCELGEKVLQIYRAAYGESNMWICEMEELLGDCKYNLGEYHSAAEYYRAALDLVEKLYAPGAQQIRKLQAKVDDACAAVGE